MNIIRCTINTKRAQRIIDSYERSSNYSLWDVYVSFSKAEAEAFESCKRKMEELQGSGMKITGACTNNFSCGCLAIVDGQKGLLYFTYRHTYFVPGYKAF